KGHGLLIVDRGGWPKEAAKGAVGAGVGDAGKRPAAAREDGLATRPQVGPEAHRSRVVDTTTNRESTDEMAGDGDDPKVARRVAGVYSFAPRQQAGVKGHRPRIVHPTAAWQTKGAAVRERREAVR